MNVPERKKEENLRVTESWCPGFHESQIFFVRCIKTYFLNKI